MLFDLSGLSGEVTGARCDVATTDSFDVLTFTLNANARSDINATIGSGFTQRPVLNVAPAVPEPSVYVYALLGVGVWALGFMARRRAKGVAA